MPISSGETHYSYQGIARFPNVIGVIDGTHIGIKAPHEHEEVFVNRMGDHSINVQVVFDPFHRIIDVVARWPGSVHDSRVLRESGLFDLFEGGHANGYYLLGDSGYPAKRLLLTPYLAPQNATEEGYNRSHKITRALLERSFGQLKKRFGVLHGEINLEPQKVCK
ncbi:putative nuclease HARBI1 [Mya arenaria]|uniref:putative nuclease HARBI1 n=1 Tax=Mya arenaria TaxID=6604 RepID=UPI0022E4BBC3|nr:putative nuclease HARBI1 [Mya arenaria]